METKEADECRVTVRELRAHFNPDDATGPVIAGYLQKISPGPFFTTPYTIARIERFQDTVPPYRIICRYLVQERPAKKIRGSRVFWTVFVGTGKQVILPWIQFIDKETPFGSR